MATLNLVSPYYNTHNTLNVSDEVESIYLTFEVGSAFFEKIIDGLLVSFIEQGASIYLANFYNVYTTKTCPSFIFENGEIVSGKDFFLALDPQLMPAAGVYKSIEDAEVVSKNKREQSSSKEQTEDYNDSIILNPEEKEFFSSLNTFSSSENSYNEKLAELSTASNRHYEIFSGKSKLSQKLHKSAEKLSLTSFFNRNSTKTNSESDAMFDNSYGGLALIKI